MTDSGLDDQKAFRQMALVDAEFIIRACRAFCQLQAFGGYVFPKSHAAAFAVLTYQSAWLQRYHPAAFFAGLLRNQPMGSYRAHVIVSEARRCGGEIRQVDVESSDLRPTVEGGNIRLGLAAVTGLGETGGQDVVQARRLRSFRSLSDFCRRTRLGRGVRRLRGITAAIGIDPPAALVAYFLLYNIYDLWDFLL